MNGFSVIIAAHNEASVIEQTLRSILANKLDRPLEVIVVANGCSDDTATRARNFSPAVQVIESPIGNKVQALNLGDKAARFFPRAFLDADIELTDNTLQQVADAFNDPTVGVVSPAAKHHYDGKNFFLAGYYRLWRSMPYVRNGVMGGGFYAIDEKLHERFDEFPAITADDKFIRNLAQPGERRVVEGCNVFIRMPAKVSSLLRVKTRWTYGNLELSAVRPDLNVNDQDQHQGAFIFLLLRPWLWIHLPFFLFVYCYAQSSARKRLRNRENINIWERDQSTRAVPPVPTNTPRPPTSQAPPLAMGKITR